MTKIIKAISWKHKQSTLDLAWRIAPPRSHQTDSCIKKKHEQICKCGCDHILLSWTEIQTLKNENKTLKDENRALKNEMKVLKNESTVLKTELWSLKMKLAKKYDCSLCSSSYSRLNRLYEHLWKGNSEYQTLAQELQRKRRCEMCK